MKGSTASQVYQLKVTLSYSKPPIWRRFLVDPRKNLYNLHQYLQVIMGWEDAHLHQFRKDKTYYGLIDEFGGEFGDDMLDETAYTISHIFDSVKSKLIYDYDMGDSWEHLVVLEKMLPKEKGQKYPMCIAGELACPPEDCGGIPGYYELLDVIKNPEHRDYNEMFEWLGDEFDPEAFDVEVINKRLRQRR